MPLASSEYLGDPIVFLYGLSKVFFKGIPTISGNFLEFVKGNDYFFLFGKGFYHYLRNVNLYLRGT